ncbi:MAG: hypothetical protein ACRCVI_02490 [Mycoplasmoidaceae bacterium]
MNKKFLKRGFLLFSVAAVTTSPLLVLINAQNVTNNTSKIKLSLNKEEQVKVLENVDMSEITNIINENNIVDNLFENNKRMSRNISREDINESLMKNIKDVKDGKILIADIEKEAINNIKYKDEYKETYESLKENLDELYLDNDQLEINITDENNLINPIFKSTSNSRSITTISGKELLSLEEFIKSKENLYNYKNVNIAVASITGIVALIAAGVALSHLSYWNFVAAAGAAVQAVALTVSTVLSAIEAYEAQKDYDYLEKILPKKEEQKIKNEISDLLKKYTRQELIGKKLFSHFTSDIIILISNPILKKGVISFVNKTLLRSSKALITQKATRKTVWLTKWASPIGKVVTYLDYVLLFVNSIIILNLYIN